MLITVEVPPSLTVARHLVDQARRERTPRDVQVLSAQIAAAIIREIECEDVTAGGRHVS